MGQFSKYHTVFNLRIKSCMSECHLVLSQLGFVGIKFIPLSRSLHSVGFSCRSEILYTELVGVASIVLGAFVIPSSAPYYFSLWSWWRLMLNWCVQGFVLRIYAFILFCFFRTFLFEVIGQIFCYDYSLRADKYPLILFQVEVQVV